jgi:hypothetical protein
MLTTVRNSILLCADRFATENPDFLTGLPHNLFQDIITGDNKMYTRTRNSNGIYQKESHIKDVPCEKCGKIFRQSTGRKRFCSRICYRANRKYIDLQGYICIKLPNHPHATTNGWVREHIVIACKKYGRYLQKDECVHHIDGNRTNNKLYNLEIIFLAIHTRKHFGKIGNRQYGEENPEIKCSCGCDGKFLKYDNRGRPRKCLQGHNMVGNV